jgi:hypothetical protein
MIMRKLLLPLFVLVLAVFIMLPSSAFSQPQRRDIYTVSVPIIKIFAHQLGYKIYYLKYDLTLGSFHVPIDWFTSAGGKGTITWGRTDVYPYFSLYWRDKKFFQIRLFLKENLFDESWGVLKVPIGEARSLFQVEEVALDF